jgi:hypothetical protein
MRNRFKFAQLETKTPTELANLFIDVAKAQTVHATNVGAGKALPVSRATMLMTEYLARLIGYCVKNEMAQPAGTISPELTTVNRLGYFRAAFEISDPVNFPSGNENSYRDNSGYYDGLTLKQKREQIALWVKQAGIYGIADYEPAWTARVTAFMADVYQAARDQVAGDGTSTPFALPTVPRDGMN